MASTQNVYQLSPKQQFIIEGQYLVYYYLESNGKWEEVERHALPQLKRISFNGTTNYSWILLSRIVTESLDIMPVSNFQGPPKRVAILHLQSGPQTYQLSDQSRSSFRATRRRIKELNKRLNQRQGPIL